MTVLATGNAVINVPKQELSLGVDNKTVTFSVFQTPNNSQGMLACYRVESMNWNKTEKKGKPVIVPHNEPDKRKKVKIKDLKAKFLATLSYQFHHTDVSGIKGEKVQDDHQEKNCNKFKIVMGWSIDDIKGQN